MEATDFNNRRQEFDCRAVSLLLSAVADKFRALVAPDQYAAQPPRDEVYARMQGEIHLALAKGPQLSESQRNLVCVLHSLLDEALQGALPTPLHSEPDYDSAAVYTFLAALARTLHQIMDASTVATLRNSLRCHFANTQIPDSQRHQIDNLLDLLFG